MTDIPGTITTAIREAIDAAVAAERERCAKIAESYYCSDSDRMSGDAVAIDAREHIAAKIMAIAVEPEGQRQLTVAEYDLLTEEFGVGWHRVGFAKRDAVLARIERMVKESIGCSDPEAEGQHFDITAGTFVSNKSDDRAGWAKRFANMAAQTIEEDRNAMQQRYADPSAQVSDIDRNKRG